MIMTYNIKFKVKTIPVYYLNFNVIAVFVKFISSIISQSEDGFNCKLAQSGIVTSDMVP